MGALQHVFSDEPHSDDASNPLGESVTGAIAATAATMNTTAAITKRTETNRFTISNSLSLILPLTLRSLSVTLRS